MKKSLFPACLFIVVLSVSGQVLKPISWKVELAEGNPNVGQEVDIRFNAKIDTDWFLYSSDFDPNLGPRITEFSFEPNDTYELIDDIEAVNPKKKYDSLWEGEYTYFEENGLFRQRVRILKKNFKIKGNYSYQVCTYIDGKCIPFDDEFSLGSSKIPSDVKKNQN